MCNDWLCFTAVACVRCLLSLSTAGACCACWAMDSEYKTLYLRSVPKGSGYKPLYDVAWCRQSSAAAAEGGHRGGLPQAAEAHRRHKAPEAAPGVGAGADGFGRAIQPDPERGSGGKLTSSLLTSCMCFNTRIGSATCMCSEKRVFAVTRW